MKEIVIKGSIDELVECEFYLVMVMGYDLPDEGWNNGMVKREYGPPVYLHTHRMGCIQYFGHCWTFTNTGPTSAKEFLSQFK